MGRPRKRVGDECEASATDFETRQRIIRAAKPLFMTKGYKGVSMKDVAEGVQVTAAALYYHFPTGKEDLFIEIVKAMFDEWANGVEGAVKDGPVREQLKALTYYALTRPYEGFHLLMHDVNVQIKDETRHREIWEYYGRTYVQHIVTIFQRAIDRGEISQQIPAHIMATLFQGMTISLLQNPRLAASRNNPVEAERLAHTVVSVLLDGVGQAAVISTG